MKALSGRESPSVAASLPALRAAGGLVQAVGNQITGCKEVGAGRRRPVTCCKGGLAACQDPRYRLQEGPCGLSEDQLHAARGAVQAVGHPVTGCQPAMTGRRSFPAGRNRGLAEKRVGNGPAIRPTGNVNFQPIRLRTSSGASWETSSSVCPSAAQVASVRSPSREIATPDPAGGGFTSPAEGVV